MLRFEQAGASYSGLTALRDVNITIAQGERVGIFGHNGAGKTTLLRCAVGDIADMRGSVRFRDQAIVAGNVHHNTRRGIGFVPQGHNVFRELSVERNLHIAGLLHDPTYVLRVFELFPLLKERRSQWAGALSGGQQQMLALGMALMTRPELLLLDEPSTGLAPIVVNDVLARLGEINKTEGTTIVMVEQNVQAAMRVVDRAIVLKTGGIIFDGTPQALQAQGDLWQWF